MELPILVAVLLAPFMFKRLQITNPFGYICFFVGLFFVVKILHHQYFVADFLLNLDPQLVVKTLASMVIYLGLAYLTALALLLFVLVPTKAAPSKSGIDPTRDFRPSPPASVLAMLLPALLIVIGLLQGVSPIENPLGFRQVIQSKGMFYVLSVELFLIVVHACYIPYLVIHRRQWPSLLALCGYLAGVAFAFISGFASMILTFVTAPLFFFSVCFKRRIEPYILIGVPLAFVYTLIYSAYRDARLNFSDISLSEAFDKVLDNPELLTAAFNRFDYLEMFVRGQQYITELTPDLGVSMLNFVFQPLPRSLWEDKPDNFSTLMTRNLLPANFDIGVTANFNSLNEFMYSFGNFGIVIGGLFLGAVLAFSYRRFVTAAHKPYDALFYVAIVLPYVSAGFMGGFINDLPLPLLLLNLLFFRIFVKRRNLQLAPRSVLRPQIA